MEATLSVEVIEEALQQSIRECEQLSQANADLREKLQNRGPRRKPRSFQRLASSCSSACSNPVTTVLTYLQHKPFHQHLGVPITDPIQFLEWCDYERVPLYLAAGKKVHPDITPAQLSELLSGELLGEDGPLLGVKYLGFTREMCKAFEAPAKALLKGTGPMMRKRVAVGNSIKSVLVNWARGCFAPVLTRSLFYRCDEPTDIAIVAAFFILVQMPHEPGISCEKLSDDQHERLKQLLQCDGDSRLCLVVCSETVNPADPRIMMGSIRDQHALHYAPVMITSCCPQGRVMCQNPVSIACLGVLSAHSLVSDDMVSSIPAYQTSQSKSLNYLLELLGSKEAVQRAIDVIRDRGNWQQRVQIRSSHLLSLMGLPHTAKIYHDVSMTRFKDGIDGQMIYTVAQVDVTRQVETEFNIKRLQAQQNALLREMLPQQVIDTLLSHQLDTEKKILRRAATGVALKSGQSMDGSSVSSYAIRAASGGLDTMDQFQQESAPTEADSASTEAAFNGFRHYDSAPARTEITTMSRMESSYSDWTQPLTAADIGNLSTFHEEVTILFACVEGLSQSVHTSQVMLFLNDVFSIVDAALHQHDVYKVETVAETYMVCAGLYDRGTIASSTPDAERTLREGTEYKSLPKWSNTLGGFDPHHATKMMCFAKAMLKAIAVVQDPSGQPVKIRIGVHSGPITTGVIGYKTPRFCCFGDTVNTASRMASTGTAGMIHSSAAFQALTPNEPWTYTGGVDVKGKGHMDTYLYSK